MQKRSLSGVFPILNMIVLSSFIGFTVENAFKLVKNGYIDNRYMFLPFLLGYGLFIAAMGILIGTPQNLFPLAKRKRQINVAFGFLIYFLLSAFLVSLGELALGFAVEKIGGFYYWDYSNLPLNFTRYTSLPTSLGFGLIITLFMGFVYSPSMRFFKKKESSPTWRTLSVILAVLLVIDFLVSFIIMIATGSRMIIWRWHIFS